MNLILEKTTGKLVPAGQPAQLARGGVQALSLQFLDSGVAELLAGGAPIAFKIFGIDDTDTPILTVDAWTADATGVRYTAALNTLAGALAWVQGGTYYGRIDYGTPNVSSGLFHLIYGGTNAAPGLAPQISIATITTVGKFLAPMVYTGRLNADGARALFGYYKVKHAGKILGAQLFAQTAPTGADVTVDLIDAGEAELSKVSTLSAGEAAEETIFGSPLNVALGDVIRAKIKTVGSGNKGGYLTMNLICENTA